MSPGGLRTRLQMSFQAFDRAELCQTCIHQARLRADAAEPARPAVAGPAVARARVRV